MNGEKNEKSQGGAIAGLAAFGCLVTGILGCVGGILALGKDQFAGAGVCFLAAAVAFGIVTYISLSD